MFRIQILTMLLAGVLVLGQRAAADSPFIVDSWTGDDALPQSTVTAVIQTRDGYLWLGTLNGLVRFDGNSITSFDLNNAPGLPANAIVFLFEDSHTNLWVGTDNAGICEISDGVIHNFDSSASGGNLAAAYETNGVVWFAAGPDPNQPKIFCFSNGVMDWNPRLGVDLRYWLRLLATRVVVQNKNGGSWHLENFTVERDASDGSVTNFGVWPWAGTPITASVEDGAGNLVVGTRGAGVYWFDESGRFQHLTQAAGLSSDYVLSLCFDSEENLWVGTDGGGLDRVRRKVFATPDELSGGVTLSAAEDANGGLWASFNLRGLTYWASNSVRHFGIGQENKPGPVLVDSGGRVWAGTSGEGVYRFAAGGFQLADVPGLNGSKISVLFQSRDGTLWAGGKNGLASFAGGVWRYYSVADGLPPYAVRALADDGHGGLWIGTGGGGVYALRDGKISPVPAAPSDIACLLVDGDGVLWAGTSAHGMARYANGNWTRYTKADGLINDVGYLMEDGLGNFWIGSYEGLMRVARKALMDFAPGSNLACRTFLTRECSSGAQPAAIRTRDGRLWFPTTEGFVSINPTDLKVNTNPPPVIIESVQVDGVELKTNLLSSGWSGAVALTPGNERLEIRFASLNFSAPKGARFGARFRYRLEDQSRRAVQAGWTDIGTERVAHFQKLEPGNYLFRVQACNEDGVWNETGATLPLTVEPPFWRKPGFIAGGILVFAAVLAGTIYLISTARLKRELRRAQAKELIEQERARIARDLHDQLGANLTQITLLGEMAETDKELPGEIEQHAQQICVTARETTRSLDEIVWAVNPSNDTLESLVNYACKYAQDYFAMAGVSYRAELPAGLPPTPILPEVRHNVFLAFKEAVNNVVKHARATEARVKLQLAPGEFTLSIADNGRGLGDISEKKLRNGLKNMRRRLADVGGSFEIGPGAGSGTVVRLIVPLK
jgi:signal transduction histidine kinase/ligand-binding sensor domain-containing protein